ncbi:hypothetical protein QBC46DRAFT_222825, partial [Diplogelasinospora grovesii]
ESTDDVDLYCEIRHYHSNRDVQWKQLMPRLSSDHARRCVRELLRHEAIATALDNVLRAPGLRDGWTLSTVHKIVNMRCDNLVVQCLDNIGTDWGQVVPGDAIYKVDPVTVKAVEGRCPKYSKLDAEEIRSRLERGSIFAAFSSEEREEIWNSLLSVDHLMPSLFTFLQDLHFLQHCADSMKHLIKLPQRRPNADSTIDSALLGCFRENRGSDVYTIEVASGVFCQIPVPIEDRFDLGRRQLWLYAMRNFKKLAQIRRATSRPLLAKVETEKADGAVLYEFAALAERLGFESPEIEYLKRHMSPGEVGNGEYSYDITERRPRRCGLPSENSYQRDRTLLFIQNLHQETWSEDITSFFVRRSVYLSIF